MSASRPSPCLFRKRPSGRALVLTAVAAALLGSALELGAQAATPPPLVVPRAAVASDHPLASEIGLAALRAGGNAVDAACATALALGVVHPHASGIGGGGFALIYIAKANQVYALDFRERAPAASRPELYLRDGKPQPELSRAGGLAVAVPGEVRGLGDMVKRWGALPFARCVAPAERLARTGFPVSWRLAEARAQLATSGQPGDAAFISSFLPGMPEAGTSWRRPDLAATLARLRTKGPDAFYVGPIADAMVKAVREAGGVLSADDLRAYRATERAPLEGRYRGLRVATMPPPSSGGVVLLETLGILQARQPDPAALARLGAGSSAYLHLLAEAFKHGFADRARHLGDPDFVRIDVARLVSPAYHQELARRLKDDGIGLRDSYGTPGSLAQPARGGGTAHLSVIDADGNAVALTTTVNLLFGAKLVAGRTGIVLNDEMDDFALAPGTPNAFGLVGAAPNAVAPGKRPLSSMTPAIVWGPDGRVKLVAGAAGGPTIITATAQVLLNVVDFEMDAQAAIAAPRVHHQWMPETLLVEPQHPRDVREGLARRGHKLDEVRRIGAANLIVRTARGLEAAAEPRSPSGAAGY